MLCYSYHLLSAFLVSVLSAGKSYPIDEKTKVG